MQLRGAGGTLVAQVQAHLGSSGRWLGLKGAPHNGRRLGGEEMFVTECEWLEPLLAQQHATHAASLPLRVDCHCWCLTS